MPNKTATHASERISAIVRKPHSASRSSRRDPEQLNSAEALARAQSLPASELSASDILSLQRTAGNRAVHSMLGAMLGRSDDSPSSRTSHQFDPSGQQHARAADMIAPQVASQPYVPAVRSSTSAPVIQRKTNTEEEELLHPEPKSPPISGNRTGLPDNLKSGIENLSGLPMDAAKVHYSSSKPAAMQALAYSQGSDIHIGPDEDEQLPTEAWHGV